MVQAVVRVLAALGLLPGVNIIQAVTVVRVFSCYLHFFGYEFWLFLMVVSSQRHHRFLTGLTVLPWSKQQ
jgi:hypothetical protein